jgi:hypothetical protein
MKNSGRLDIQRIIRLYKVIALYELDEIEKYDLEIRSSNRFFKINNVKGEAFEETILNLHLKQIFNSNVGDFKHLIQNLIQYLTQLKQSPNADSLLGLDEILIWAESKLSIKPKAVNDRT